MVIRLLAVCLLLFGCAGTQIVSAEERWSAWKNYADTQVLQQADDSFGAIYVDFTRLLKRDLKQDSSIFDMNSIRVAPLSNGVAGEAVSHRFIPDSDFDAKSNARGHLVFQVAGSKEESPQTYRVFFNTGGNQAAANRDDPSVPERANMVWNGGFEILSTGYSGSNPYHNPGANMPRGYWGNIRDWFKQNPAREAHSGKHAFALTMAEAGKIRSLWTAPTAPGQRIVPGQTYVISFWVKGEELSSDANLICRLFWYRADKSTLGSRMLRPVPLGAKQFPWTQGYYIWTAPDNARYAHLIFSSLSPTGMVTIDDIEMRPAIAPLLENAKVNS